MSRGAGEVNSAAQIAAAREGGKVLAGILRTVRARSQPGTNELDIDAWVAKEIVRCGAEISYKEVDFPGAVCISVNDELIHGAPKDYVYREGDKVSYDLTITYHGMHIDAAFSMIIGQEEPSGAKGRLLKITENALRAGIAEVKAGSHTGDIGSAVEKVLKAGKLGIIRDYIGHGIGTKMHQAPDIPNYGRRGTGEELQAGELICIEPMASLGKEKTEVNQEDGWTVSLKDGSIGAHFEHTVLVLPDGYEVLTEGAF